MTDAEKYLKAQDPLTNSTFNIVPDKEALIESYGDTLFLFKDGTMITGNREYTAFYGHNLNSDIMNAGFYRTESNNIGFKYQKDNKNYNIDFKDTNLTTEQLKSISKDTGLPLEGLKEVQAAELSFKENLKNIMNNISNKTKKVFKKN
tara:strand:+ start:8562 stop:9005 length:444 start_codon:yes stop_codon:yes gene_type:complete